MTQTAAIKLLNAATATGDGAVFNLAFPQLAAAVQMEVTGSPTRVVASLLALLDGGSWDTICVLDTNQGYVAGEIVNLFPTPVRQVKANVGTMTGGINPTVSFYFTSRGYRPGIALPGDTVQSLLTTNSAASTGSNNLTFNTSAPTVAAGNLVASQAITPKSSAHLVRIEGQALIGTPSGTATADIGLWVTQDAGANSLCTASTNTSRGTTSPVDVGLLFQQLANTLVSTTFKLYAALNGSLVVSINTVIGGSAFYGGTANSYILVEEIAT